MTSMHAKLFIGCFETGKTFLSLKLVHSKCMCWFFHSALWEWEPKILWFVHEPSQKILNFFIRVNFFSRRFAPNRLVTNLENLSMAPSQNCGSSNQASVCRKSIIELFLMSLLVCASKCALLLHSTWTVQSAVVSRTTDSSIPRLEKNQNPLRGFKPT